MGQEASACGCVRNDDKIIERNNLVDENLICRQGKIY